MNIFQLIAFVVGLAKSAAFDDLKAIYDAAFPLPDFSSKDGVLAWLTKLGIVNPVQAVIADSLTIAGLKADQSEALTKEDLTEMVDDAMVEHAMATGAEDGAKIISPATVAMIVELVWAIWQKFHG